MHWFGVTNISIWFSVLRTRCMLLQTVITLHTSVLVLWPGWPLSKTGASSPTNGANTELRASQNGSPIEIVINFLVGFSQTDWKNYCANQVFYNF